MSGLAGYHHPQALSPLAPSRHQPYRLAGGQPVGLCRHCREMAKQSMSPPAFPMPSPPRCPSCLHPPVSPSSISLSDRFTCCLLQSDRVFSSFLPQAASLLTPHLSAFSHRRPVIHSQQRKGKVVLGKESAEFIQSPAFSRCSPYSIACDPLFVLR